MGRDWTCSWIVVQGIWGQEKLNGIVFGVSWMDLLCIENIKWEDSKTFKSSKISSAGFSKDSEIKIS